MAVSATLSKLQCQDLPVGYISRPRLVNQLQSARRITLVVAGAGYGKSALLTEWVQEKKRLLWYNLDSVDGDPAVFFAHLLAGIEKIWPGRCLLTKAVLNRPVMPDPERLAMALVQELDVVLANDGLFLVLDDYHRLGEATAVDRILKFLLERLPPTVHIVVSSRTPLPFMARFQAAGQVSQLTQNDLRFTPEEIAQLFSQTDTSPPVVAEWLNRTEGWAAGLELIRQALAFLPSTETLQLSQPMKAPQEQIYLYLTGELFSQQPSDLQQFLLQTAILNTFSAVDSDTIFERNDSAQWLNYLASQNLFTIRLQHDLDMYRYHHLLVDYLCQKLDREGDPAQIRDWRHRAATYYLKRQQWDVAFENARYSSDDKLIADVIGGALFPAETKGQLGTLQNWLDQLSPSIFQSCPQLYAIQAKVWIQQGRYLEAQNLCYRAIEIAQPLNDFRALSLTWVDFGLINQRIGNLEGALEAFQKTLHYAEQSGKIQDRWNALNGLANIHLYFGQNRQALAFCHQTMEIASSFGKPIQAMVMQNLSTTWVQLGELDQVLYWAQSALVLRRELGQTMGLYNSLNNLMRYYIFVGKLAEAHTTYDEICTIEDKVDQPLMVSYMHSNRGDLAAVEGDFVQAEMFYRRSLEIKEPLQDALGLVHTWTRMSELRRRQKDVAGALAYAQRAMELGEGKVGMNEWLPAQTAWTLAQMLQGELNTAVEQLNQIIASHQQTTENQYELTRCLWYLAHAYYLEERPYTTPLTESLTLAEREDYHFLIMMLAQETPELLRSAVAANLQPGLITRIVAQLGETAVPLLTPLLQSPQAVGRQRAVEQLATLGLESVWEPIFQAAQDQEAAVKKAADAALAHLQRTSPPPLRVTTLGRFTLQRGDVLISDKAWESRKAQALFNYLLAHAGTPINRHQLLELFWPDSWPADTSKKQKKVEQNLRQLIFLLRNILEPYLPPRFTSRYLFSEGEKYRLVLPPGSWVDDQTFEGLVSQARLARRQEKPDMALAIYQEAITLYQGNYLDQEKNIDWHLPRQEHLRQMMLEALQTVATLQFSRQEWEQARKTAERIIHIEPLDEEAYYWLMQAGIALGQPVAARRVYQRYETLFRQEDLPLSVRLHVLFQQI